MSFVPRQRDVMPVTQDRQPIELLDVPQVCGLFKCSRRTLARLIRDGKVPAPCRVGRLVRFDARRIREFIENGGTEVRK